MTRVRRLLPLALLLLAACGTPSVSKVTERWPDSLETLVPVPKAVSDRYERALLDQLDGVEEVRLFRLATSPKLGHFDVLVLRTDSGFSPDEVNQLRCDVLAQVGGTSSLAEDEYDGELGMHGQGGRFSVDADGVAVVVVSSMDDAQAREVAEALGGEDDDAAPCEAGESTG